MWAGSPPHRNGHERHPRYAVLYDFSFGEGGGYGAGESRRDKNLVFFLNFAPIMNNSRGPFEYAKRT